MKEENSQITLLEKLGVNKNKNAVIIGIILLAIIVVIPFAVANNYFVSLITNCLIFGAFGLAWNLIGGYGGQVSWCHCAFVAIGGYTSILMFNMLGVSPFISMPVGMIISYIVATGIGAVSFRYRGPFFSITTIAFGEIVRILLLHFEGFTNGSRGISVQYSDPSFFKLMFADDKPFYFIMLVVVLLMVFITGILEKSKIGYYLRTIKDDEDASISIGINTGKVKLQAFQISAVLTSALGTIYAFYTTFYEPNTICSLDMAVKIGSIAIVGGVATKWGPLLGAFIVIPLTELASAVLGAAGGAQLLYGLALIIVVLFQPSGVIQLLRQVSDKIAKRKKTKEIPQ